MFNRSNERMNKMRNIKLKLLLVLLAVSLPSEAWGDVSVRVRRGPASRYRKAPPRRHHSGFDVRDYFRSRSRRAVGVKRSHGRSSDRPKEPVALRRSRRAVDVKRSHGRSSDRARRPVANRRQPVKVYRRPRVVIERQIVVDPWYARSEVVVQRPVARREVIIERPVETIKQYYWLGQLRSSSSDDRERAAKKLRKFPSAKVQVALENTLLNDRDEDVRQEAAKSLGKIGDIEAIPALRHAALMDREDDVREEAVEAIENIERTLECH